MKAVRPPSAGFKPQACTKAGFIKRRLGASIREDKGEIKRVGPGLSTISHKGSSRRLNQPYYYLSLIGSTIGFEPETIA